MKSITIIVVLITISSCSCNSVLFGPYKNPKTARTFNWQQVNDSICLNISGNNCQPTYITNKKDTLNFDYTIESVFFKSSNGNILNGWLLKPKYKKAQVTLLHLHGNAGNLFTQIGQISPLAKKGFQIFMFDYSGFGYSEGMPSKENILTDANSALDYLETREEIKSTKLVIYDQSIGGNLAVVLAKQRQKEIDALVTEGAFTSYHGIASHYIPLVGGLIISQSYSAIDSITQFHKPVLIIHSREDKIIPFRMGKKLYRKANQPKDFFEIKGYHINGTINYTTEIADKIKTMLGVRDE